MEHLSPSDGSRAAGSDRPRSRAPPKRQRSNSDMSDEDAAAALRGVFTRTPRPSGSGIDGLAVLTAALSAQAPAAAPQQTPAPVTVDAPETPAVDRRLTTGASAWPAAAPFSTPRDAEPVARTVSTTEGDPAAAPDVKLLQNRVATLEQMLVERDAFISQLFAKTHPGADGAAPSVTPRQPPPTVDVEATPLRKTSPRCRRRTSARRRSRSRRRCASSRRRPAWRSDTPPPCRSPRASRPWLPLPILSYLIPLP